MFTSRIWLWNRGLKTKPRYRNDNRVLSFLVVIPQGLEPRTASLEGRCSIQLSYEPEHNSLRWVSPFVKKTINVKKMVFLSGWQDSNLRPPRPKRGAMTGLRYTPINRSSVFPYNMESACKSNHFSCFCNNLRRDGDSNPGYPVRVRLFSKQVLSASQAPLQCSMNGGQK